MPLLFGHGLYCEAKVNGQEKEELALFAAGLLAFFLLVCLM